MITLVNPNQTHFSLGITLFFLIPRAPSFEFYEQSPFSVDNSTIDFNRVPTNFSFTGNLNLYGEWPTLRA